MRALDVRGGLHPPDPSCHPPLHLTPPSTPLHPPPALHTHTHSAVRAAIIPGKTTLVMVESPTNPRMQICDIAAIAAIARAAGAVTCVDNSIMAPLFQRPLDLGADVCMTSGTKFIGGHGDVTLGLLSVRGKELAQRLYFFQVGGGLGGWEGVGSEVWWSGGRAG